MSQSKITLIGFSNYMKNHDADLFELVSFPEGINKDTFVNNLLLKGGEFEVLYSDPFFMRDAIGIWSNKWDWTFNKWIKALEFKYDPLYNYDRYEEWEETEAIDETIKEKEKEEITEKDKEVSNGTAKRTDTGTSGTDTQTEDKVSAFNSSAYEPNNQQTGSSDTTTHTQSDETNTNNVTSDRDSNRDNTKDTNRDHDRTNKRKGRLYGNIGVTTSQQMLQSELELAYWGLYDKIADLFITEFCVPVYE